MPALNFPAGPGAGALYPANPGTSGVTQYRWNNVKGTWDAVLPTISLGSPNQGAYNDYQWPIADGALNQQLTTDGAGNLTWEAAATPSIQVLSILPSELPFDGVTQSFTLVDSGTLLPYAPNPSTNIVVFLGGVPQTPGIAYNVVGSTINFMGAPLLGTTFYAITNIVL